MIIRKIDFYYLLLLFLTCHSSILKHPVLTTEEERLFTKLINANSMSSLNLRTSKNSKTEFKLGTINNFFSFVLNGIKSDFELNLKDSNILVFNKDENINVLSSIMSFNKGLDFNGDLKIRNIKQWKLIKEEDFSTEPTGWTNNSISYCAGIHMLGGYCKFSSGETSKTFENLPPHEHIRIQATFHFIDAWNGETGYMKLGSSDNDMGYYWTEKYSSFLGEGGVNVCGGKWPEGKFANPIDVSFKHEDDKIRISFGSTLGLDPCEESFGVSGLKIYVR